MKKHALKISATTTLNVWDDGEGPVVVLVHGIPGSSGSWTSVAALLARSHRVLIPDLLGFGASSHPSDPEALLARPQGEALGDALDALGVGAFTLVGHDFGGPVALSLLAARPEAITGLGLLATNTFPDTPIPFPLSTVTWPCVGWLAARGLFSRPSLRMMLRHGAGRPDLAPDPATAIGDEGQAAAIAAIFSSALRRLEELYAPIEASLRTVAVPTIVAWGDRDPFFPIEQGMRTARAVPGAHLELLAGAGHFLPEERPAEVASLIVQLVKGVRAAPRSSPPPPP